MLRVGGGPPPPGMPPTGDMPPDAAPPMPPPDDMSADDTKVDPMVAGYKTPDIGPFICGNCYHFDGESSCQIVSGQIDPEGVCNLFTPHKGGADETAVPPEAEGAAEPQVAPPEMA